MDVDAVEAATGSGVALEHVWRTPQSDQQLVTHPTPELHDVVEQRQP